MKPTITMEMINGDSDVEDMLSCILQDPYWSMANVEQAEKFLVDLLKELERRKRA